jgi:UDP-3-O-acyl-N-acetylglucosamine deacetylase
MNGEVRGRGLFSGTPGAVRIAGAAVGSGIRIARRSGGGVRAKVVALAPQPEGIPARNTTLAIGATDRILTVEHLMSALAGLGVWDARVEAEGPEVPIGDGSAAAFVDAVRGAGLRKSGAEPIVISREIVIERGGARIVARPRSPGRGGCLYRYELDYGPDAPMAAQAAEWDSGAADAAETYAREVAPARTFCLESEARILQAAGLFKDLSPRDMLVIGADGPIENEYRFENEPARHKLLDLIGDLALAGGPLQGEVVATRAGHAMNHEMARALAALR